MSLGSDRVEWQTTARSSTDEAALRRACERATDPKVKRRQAELMKSLRRTKYETKKFRD